MSLPAIARFGIWDRIASLQPYLDPAVGPSAAALLFFEHLLKPSLAEARAQLLAHRARQPSADFGASSSCNGRHADMFVFLQKYLYLHYGLF